jgi:hypothetical protein
MGKTKKGIAVDGFFFIGTGFIYQRQGLTLNQDKNKFLKIACK